MKGFLTSTSPSRSSSSSLHRTGEDAASWSSSAMSTCSRLPPSSQPGEEAASTGSALALHRKKTVDYVLLVIHGIGSSDRALSKQSEDLQSSLEFISKHWFWEIECTVHVELINWKSAIVDAQNHIFDRISLSSNKDTRKVLNLTAADLMCFLTPRYGDFIIAHVATQINGLVRKLRKDPSGAFANSELSIVGYSLGSVIAYELLTAKALRESEFLAKGVTPPQLEFSVRHFFSLGSSLAAFLLLHNPELLRGGLALRENVAFYNLFHSFDPVAFRMEPLFYPDRKNLPNPVLLPYWRNNGIRDWHDWDTNISNAKNAIVQNFSDFTNTISKSIHSWWGDIPGSDAGSLKKNALAKDSNSQPKTRQLDDFRTQLRSSYRRKNETSGSNPSLSAEVVSGTMAPPSPAGAHEHQDHNCSSSGHTKHKKKSDNREKWRKGKAAVETEEGGRESGTDDSFDEEQQTNAQSRKRLETLNMYSGEILPLRYDFQLQEDTAEHYFSGLAMLQSHFNYWRLKDGALFILKCLTAHNPTMSYPDHLKKLERQALKAKKRAERRHSNKAEVVRLQQLAESRHKQAEAAEDLAEQQAVADRLNIRHQTHSKSAASTTTVHPHVDTEQSSSSFFPASLSSLISFAYPDTPQSSPEQSSVAAPSSIVALPPTTEARDAGPNLEK